MTPLLLLGLAAIALWAGSNVTGLGFTRRETLRTAVLSVPVALVAWVFFFLLGAMAGEPR